jgi:hypothetical protein
MPSQAPVRHLTLHLQAAPQSISPHALFVLQPTSQSTPASQSMSLHAFEVVQVILHDVTPASQEMVPHALGALHWIVQAKPVGQLKLPHAPDVVQAIWHVLPIRSQPALHSSGHAGTTQ